MKASISASFERFPVLISYAYARKDEARFAKLAARDDLDILLDCGAYTAYNSGHTITMTEYCEFLDKYKDRLFAYMALDVVGNAKATRKNLDEMYEAGYDPMPIHVVGDTKKRLDELYERTDYVALAGVNRVRKLEIPLSFIDTYIKEKMKWANGRKVHWLGVTRRKILAAFRPASCDSSTWANGQVYGQCSVYMGNGRFVTAYGANGKQEREKLISDPKAMAIARRVVPDFDRTVYDDRAWRLGQGMDHVAEITTDSWVRFAIDFYRHFGTRIFLATSVTEQNSNILLRAVERNRSKLKR